MELTIDKTRFDELKDSGNLPSPTGVAMSVLRLTAQESTTIEELAAVLQTDPALSGKLLKFANSALATGRNPTASVS